MKTSERNKRNKKVEVHNSAWKEPCDTENLDVLKTTSVTWLKFGDFSPEKPCL
jgi:hypothetical protein